MFIEDKMHTIFNVRYDLKSLFRPQYYSEYYSFQCLSVFTSDHSYVLKCLWITLSNVLLLPLWFIFIIIQTSQRASNYTTRTVSFCFWSVYASLHECFVPFTSTLYWLHLVSKRQWMHCQAPDNKDIHWCVFHWATVHFCTRSRE